MTEGREIFDIKVRKSRYQNHPRRLRRWQKREREEARGPLTLRAELKMLVPGAKRLQYLCVEPSYVVACRNARAVAYVRRRMRELMTDLDRTGLLIPDASLPADAREQKPESLPPLRIVVEGLLPRSQRHTSGLEYQRRISYEVCCQTPQQSAYVRQRLDEFMMEFMRTGFSPARSAEQLIEPPLKRLGLRAVQPAGDSGKAIPR